MEFVRGAKLNSLPPAEIRALVKVGMEVFLTQLLVIGFMHSDPHPGNLLKVLIIPLCSLIYCLWRSRSASPVRLAPNMPACGCMVTLAQEPL